MKKVMQFLLLLLIMPSVYAQEDQKINTIIDQWHQAAAKADFDTYFGLLHDDCIFIGTDATERWDKAAFIAYSKPHFDKGKAWTMLPLERHLIYATDKKTVWFDELLDTSMKLCRGSGVLTLENGKWKIKHYVLSMTIPNDLIKEIVPMKTPEEDKIIKQLK